MDSFKKNILSIWKDKGQDWLAKLPTIIEQCSTKWNLHDLQPASNLSYNYVCFGYQNKKDVVLKLGVDTTELQKEVAALSFYNGNGCVRLLQSDFVLNALLLESIM